jgi:lactoylglutathione lyase
MPTTIGNIAINVSDLERSERFYVEVIGLEVLARIETPDVREVLLGSSDGGSQLMLARHTAQEGPVDAGGGMWKVYLATDDALGLYERALAAGAADVAPPKHLEAYKVTIAFVHDPDGHLLEFGQRHL